MKKDNGNDFGLKQILSILLLLFLATLFFIARAIYPFMVSFDVELLLIPLAVFILVRRVIRFFLKLSEDAPKTPWAERVLSGTEEIGQEKEEEKELPWAERILSGIEEPEVEPPEESHDHIPSSQLSPKARLEQLKVLKEAGLLDQAEYEEKKREIKMGT